MASPGSVGSAMPASEDTQVRRVADLERFVRELGPSVAKSLATTVQSLRDLIAQVTATLANINATVAQAISDNSMTTAAIQSLVAAPPAGSAVTGDVSATGNVSAGGNLGVTGTANIGGIVTADAGMSSTDIRNRLLSSGYVSVYADSTGRLGYVPSSLAVKTIIAPYTASLEDWLAVDAQIFYYNADENRTPRVGFIAEWVNAHFPEFVVHDAVDGEEGTHPAGLHYEFMIAGMQSAFQQFVAEQRAETNALKARLDALGG